MSRLMLAFCSLLLLQEVGTAADDVDYVRNVKPILSTHCYACHGVLKSEAALRLDTAAAALKGGDSGPTLVPGKPDASELIRRVTSDDESVRMPAEGKPLSKDQIAILSKWIGQGARAPADEKPQLDPRQHWSFQSPVRPDVPSVEHRQRVRNPIDAFIVAQHEKLGLEPRPAASKSTLLRRVYLDLIGLPPSPVELRAFLDDPTPDAYDKIVDRLLNSPQYGERWGRHWMDVWRYSDWYGRRGSNEIRYSQRHIWRWRDWIIESVSADKSYDRMIVEMLAGDEVAPADPDTLRATGFLGRNWYKFDRDVWFFDTVEKTSMGLLGLTLKCARCHDHKYDPITQRDYYQFRAFFEPHAFRIDPVSALTDTEIDNGKDKVLKAGLSRAFDIDAKLPTYLYIRGNGRNPVKDDPLPPAVPAVFRASEMQIEPIALPAEAYYPAIQPRVVETTLRQAEAAVAATEAELKRAEASVIAARSALEKNDVDKVETSSSKGSRAFFEDNFSSPRPDDWKVLSGKWQYRDGHVAETELGSFLTMITSANHPRDFQARVRYKSTNPGSLHSVGFNFDAVGMQSFQAIYTHASGNATAVHAFHRQNGKDVYPQNAIVPHPIRIGEMVTLDFAVRGSLLNIWIDGELKLAYQMPMPRQSGKFALWCHQGTAEFHEVKIAALDEKFPLASKATQRRRSPFIPPTRTELEKELKAVNDVAQLERLRVTAASARLRELKAKVAAERARLTDNPDAMQLAKQASQAERQQFAARTTMELKHAEHELAMAQSRKSETKQNVAKAEKKVAAARKQSENARAALKEEKDTYQPLGKMYPKTSTGRRLALARWMVDPSNPRTARVAVNHIWLRHFGRALVPTVSNFGLAGRPPSHPELLDWLAVELMESGWSTRHIHRLIVTSNTYRMQSTPGSKTNPNHAIDPDNINLWRMNSRRMEAEVVRDSLLALTDAIDSTMGGPELTETLGETSARRSVYFRVSPDNKMEMLELFDLANPTECYQREESVVPQQALVLSNSGLALSQARRLASRLSKFHDATHESEFIDTAFEFVLSRLPTDAEQKACSQFLIENTTLLRRKNELTAFPARTATRVPAAADPYLRARQNLVHTLFNHNDFVTIR